MRFSPKHEKTILDDIRTIEMMYDHAMVDDFDIVRTYWDFMKCIQQNGLPDFISFDNDLGLDKNGKLHLMGMPPAKWLVYESGQDFVNLKFHVHLANPIASEQIYRTADNYIKFLKEKGTTT